MENIYIQEHIPGGVPRKMNKALGFNLWSGTLTHAPYDTGNLVHSIRLKINAPYVKKINYDLTEAYYTKILEEGRAPGEGKKHKGFISERTVPELANMVAAYFEGGWFSKTSAGASRRQALSSTAKVRGFGKGKVTIGRSRYSSRTRNDVRRRSLNRTLKLFSR